MSHSIPVTPTECVSFSKRRKIHIMRQAAELSKAMKLKKYIKITLLTVMLRKL